MAEYIEREAKWIEISSVRKIGKCNIPISKCSCCGFSFCDILNSYELYKLCPSCGARMDATQNIETCICCGETIPEGRQVCPKCEKGV